MTTIEAKRTIPQLRERLVQIAYEIMETAPDYGRELLQIAGETTRRYGGRKARARFPKPTPELAEEIRATARRYPNASQQQIAQWCKTNPGRVSEALIGKRNGERL